jgi:hypothetical protein
MPKSPPKSSGLQSSDLPQTLTDRVLAQVAEARLAIERSPGAARGKAKRDAVKVEALSLRRVFRDMGISYRRYRKETGEPVMPDLRAAAYHFQAEPNLTSLVTVAGYLDELGLLSR